jgi:rubrerythrin
MVKPRTGTAATAAANQATDDDATAAATEQSAAEGKEKATDDDATAAATEQSAAEGKEKAVKSKNYEISRPEFGILVCQTCGEKRRSNASGEFCPVEDPRCPRYADPL